ncbi:LysR substrate-binding domain-containing protein [Pseudomonas sp. zfem002]|uniref:LysR substrate-binding domain-containing protein n=1 Tax=Pseudomonas sp. zfem002 TaxID=3078197 RepID=UPI0029279982|nr:LysR substrate-binding domain-containing protein [Pseudomonas sp. zfem002]MDU9390369.1 LysR substrate-binding domain-containing protein [Pseudomonas sp. zfem002]
MTRRLPGTTALLALEAAARHRSFARAAQELSLSEGAISRQIAKLESLLDVRLFHRVGNRVELTEPGARYAADMREALDLIERKTRQLQAESRVDAPLEIGVIPTFASRWLIPRMARFHQCHPQIRINLRERTEPFDLADSGLHAAINVEHPAWAGMQVEPLFQAPLLAVCHPDLAGRPPAGLPLLHKHEDGEQWADYARHSGIDLPATHGGPRYDRFSLLIDAARAGMGMALVPRLYVEDDLRDGRLVAPWPEVAQLSERYVLVSRPGEDPTALGALRRWLLEEIGGRPAGATTPAP